MDIGMIEHVRKAFKLSKERGYEMTIKLEEYGLCITVAHKDKPNDGSAWIIGYDAVEESPDIAFDAIKEMIFRDEIYAAAKNRVKERRKSLKVVKGGLS